MAEKSKILVIGATGYIGKLSRQGDIYNHESLVNAIKQVDVVISAVGGRELADQVNIIAAIEEAGSWNCQGKLLYLIDFHTISSIPFAPCKSKFLPSEFGCDMDRVEAVEPAASLFAEKAKIRRILESEGIPFTYVVSNGFAGYFLPTLGQLNATQPPKDKVLILGDGNPKAIFVEEEDIAVYTVKAVDDPRTLNKILYMRPPANILSFNELVAMWEFKIGKYLEKTHILEDELLKNIQDAPMPLNVLLAISHSVLVKGAAFNFEIDASSGVEATDLDPEITYTTVDEYLNQFI
ncbi:hypothetical protein Pfo_018594 [Paulownia fortunei]|nr:hypothetical protein Pfo_018594 [Paulownia fortunei]